MRRGFLAIMIAAAVFAVAGTGYAQGKAPATVILKGAPLGGVKFDHAKHSKMTGVACTKCHHASKPAKPMKAAQEACTDCHQKTAAAPMTTTVQMAFHKTCQPCHAEQVKAGNKTAPTAKCTDCHKKENV
jgi:hypothetical protein